MPVELLGQRGVAFLRRDILGEGDDIPDRPDRHEIDTCNIELRLSAAPARIAWRCPVKVNSGAPMILEPDGIYFDATCSLRCGNTWWNEAVCWRGRTRERGARQKLHAPTAGRSTEIDAAARLGQEVILLVQLYQFEGRATAVALLLRQLIELIQPARQQQHGTR